MDESVIGQGSSVEVRSQMVIAPVASPTTPTTAPTTSTTHEHQLGRAKMLPVVLAAGHHVEDRAGRVDDARQQQELEPGGVDEEQRVDGGDPRRRSADRRARSAIVLVRLAASRASLSPYAGDEEVRHEREARAQVEHEVERVVGRERDEQEHLDQHASS